MKLLRRRKIIFVILVTIWLGGMIYFLAPLAGTKGDSRQSAEFDSLLGDTSEMESPERGIYDKHGDINGGTYNDNKDLSVIKENSDEKDNRRIEDFDVESYLSVTRVKKGDDAYASNAYNQEASDKAAFDRDVPDVRDSQCQKRSWSTDLPTTSIIICFHNEGRAALLRTIVSSLIRSPPNLLKEIILVDDFSDNRKLHY